MSDIDPEMSRDSLVALLHEHDELTHGLVRLVDMQAFADAAYVTAIMQTDLSELGHVPEGSTWPCPGQVPPAGWPLYEAAIRWGQSGFRT